MAHKIHISLVRTGKRGLLYDCEYAGEKICQSTTTPFLDACRVLKHRGMSGPVEMWDGVRPYPRMRGSIEVAAGLSVSDGSAGGVRFRKYVSVQQEATQDGKE